MSVWSITISSALIAPDAGGADDIAAASTVAVAGGLSQGWLRTLPAASVTQPVAWWRASATLAPDGG